VTPMDGEIEMGKAARALGWVPVPGEPVWRLEAVPRATYLPFICVSEERGDLMFLVGKEGAIESLIITAIERLLPRSSR
jgi:hypothetical protein